MKRDKFDRAHIILYFLGILPVVWLALLVAPAFGDGLAGFLQKAYSVFSNPLHIKICENSTKAVLIFLMAYAVGLGIFLSNDRNYRRREEHGSAKWGSPGSINKKYANRDRTENKILTQNVSIGLDGRKHRRNLNTVTEIQDILGISMTTAYALIKRKEFHSVNVGRHIRISKASFDAWLNGQ